MDVDSIPQYQKNDVDAVHFDESNQLQKLPWSNHHDQKKNLHGYEPNYLQKPSCNHHNQNKYLTGDDYLESHKEKARKARSILSSMLGFSPANLWDDDQQSDEEFMQSMKKVREWEASNTCTNCGYFNWKCRCKLVHIEELWKAREALKGPSTPVKTEPKETLLSFVLGRL